jgi:hypothetical protein
MDEMDERSLFNLDGKLLLSDGSEIAKKDATLAHLQDALAAGDAMTARVRQMHTDLGEGIARAKPLHQDLPDEIKHLYDQRHAHLERTGQYLEFAECGMDDSGNEVRTHLPDAGPDQLAAIARHQTTRAQAQLERYRVRPTRPQARDIARRLFLIDMALYLLHTALNDMFEILLPPEQRAK